MASPPTWLNGFARTLLSTLCLAAPSLLVTRSLAAEGSAQVGLNQPLVEYSLAGGNAMFVDILSGGEVINVSLQGETVATDTVRIRILDPMGMEVVNTTFVGGNIAAGEESLSGPLSTPLRFVTGSAGKYEVQLTNENDDLISLFDVTVTGNNTTDPNPTLAGGRLHAMTWSYNAGTYAKAESTDADYFALVPGGVPNTNYVWRLDLNKFAGFAYSIAANQLGVNAPFSGLSVEADAPNDYAPEYDIYVGYPAVAGPEPAAPPSLTNVGFVDNAGDNQSISPGSTFGIQDTGTFQFDSDIEGSYSIAIDTNGDGFFGAGDLYLNGTTVIGTNSVVWDGTDVNGDVLPVGQYKGQISTRLGEYHFISDDAETSGGDELGLTIYREQPGGISIPTLVFWDDLTLLGGGTTLPTGALSNTNAGRHTWGNFESSGAGFGNERFIDTYVYGLTSVAEATAVVANDDAPLVDTDGDEVFDEYDLDDDNDGIPDSAETGNQDGDALIDSLDLDSDNDGVPDYREAGGADSDGNGLVDSFADFDFDGLDDTLAATPLDDNDTDGDSLRDRLDLDSDNDGIQDIVEAGGSDPSEDGVVEGFLDMDTNGWDDGVEASRLADLDGDSDGRPDRADIDSDGDGIVDNVEGQTSLGYTPPDQNDGDVDGWDDAYDSDNGGVAFDPTNTDLADLPDYRDLDSDNDNVPDAIEGHDSNMNGQADVTPDDNDVDDDGLDDAFDTVSGRAANNATGSNASLQNTDGIDERDWRDTDDDDDGIDTVDEDTNGNDDPTDDDLNGDGRPDYLDDGDSDGDDVPDTTDLDGDNDGIPNSVEGTGDSDGDSIPDAFDLDSDNDGIPDVIEAGGVDANGDGRIDGFLDGNDDGLDDDLVGSPLADPNTDGDARRDRVDIDSDGDGIVDNVEAQTSAGYSPPDQNDNDLDGWDDAYDSDDGGAAFSLANTDSIGLPDYRDDDSDEDGVPDAIEGHDTNANGEADTTPDSSDADGDGLDDAFDTVSGRNPSNATGSNAPLQNFDGIDERDWRDEDDDDDGVDTADEDANNNGDPTDDDINGDGSPDYLDDGDSDGDDVPDTTDLDGDNDGIPNSVEGGGDTDGDGVPDQFDLDSDNDGIPDLVEAGGADVDGNGRVDGFADGNDDGFDDGLAGNPLSDPNTDGDSRRDRVDIDSDADGIVDNVEGQESANFEPLEQVDTDGDGWDDAYDSDDGGTAISLANTDGEGLPDYLDTDSDNDGVLDNIEGHDMNRDGVADATRTGNDADNDGLDNGFDTVSGRDSGNSSGSNAPLQNTDGVDERDWRDADDDNDGLDTEFEDSDDDGNFGEEDGNRDGTPNYLDFSTVLIEVDKSVRDVNGAPLAVGDRIAYNLEVRNESNLDAVNVTIQDTIPANSSYVPNSTIVDGVAIADIGALSPLVNGLLLQSGGSPAGTIMPGDFVAIRFEVTVDASAAAGTQIANTAQVEAELGSGGRFVELSDNPETSTDDDASLATVGNSPALRVTKAATDVNSPPLAAGDSIRYSILLENTGTAAVTNLVVTDVIPANTAYTNGSLELDLDAGGGGLPVVLSEAGDGDAGDFGVTTAGAITVAIDQLAAGGEALVEFTVQVGGGVAPGTVISNQAFVASDELRDTLSDSDADSSNGSQATSLAVGSSPALRLLKTVADVNGGTALPGDVLEYRLELTNLGTGSALNVNISDTIPPVGTNYISGSTTLDGVNLADAGGPSSPLNAGITIPTVAVGQTAILTVRVQIQVGLAAGAVISNQAAFTANGGLSGVSDSDLDDGLETGNDSGNPNDDDPTRLTVGGAPGSATIGGLVWLDTDHDRNFDVTEDGIQGFGVEVLQNGVLVDSTTTGSDGAWQFQGLTPGSGYQVRFRDPVSGAVWGDPISDVPGSTVDGGIVDNLNLPSGTSFVDLSLPLDPSGVIYDSLSRDPLTGATLTLEGPAGFDPALHLLPGQEGQTTGADGYYRFDLVGAFPPGVYSLRVNAPNGYSPIVPSLVIAVEPNPLDPTGFPDPFLVAPNNGAPMGADPTTYYLDFDLAAGDPNVINNHVPLDAIGTDPFTVIKTSSKNRVSVGEIVPFTIRATNNLPAGMTGLAIVDLLPPGFKYVEGSAQVNDVAMEPVVDADGRRLIWGGADFALDETYTVRLLAVVGSGVQRGVFVNRGFVEDSVGTLLSNVGEATLLVIPDPLFDQSDVIGQVFEDADGDGYQDEGERGIPGVTLVTVRGLRVTTDEFGRYHIARPEDPTPGIGSNFILKIDPATLPSDYVITSENPRVIRMTPGKLHKVNFGVISPRRKASGAEGFSENSLGSADGQEPGAQEPGKGELLGGLLNDEANGRAERSFEEDELQARVEGELDPLDIRIRVDRSSNRPALNAIAKPDVVETGQPMFFYSYSDYRRWIERTEVRVFAENESTRSEPLVVIPTNFRPGGTGWPANLEPGNYQYLLRAYGKDGVFDETAVRTLTITKEPHLLLHEPSEPFWPGYGESNLAISNIQVQGVKVLVDGEDVPNDHRVAALGFEVPVDKNGRFAFSQWFDFGNHQVSVNVRSSAGEGLQVNRELLVPKDEWFFVGLAELTLGSSSADRAASLLSGSGGLIEDATGSAFDDEAYLNGRAALYLKGKIKGEYLLTASLDTRDQPLDQVLKGLTDKDPQSVFRRIQPDEVYAVYGDDSTTLQDAPTQGKLYVRLERGDSYALWGNFNSGLVGTDLAQVDRALYGAKLHWESDEKTEFGDDRSSVDVFAASPDTVVGRDELQGTGGSVYFLKTQDLSVGSERLRVQIRDRDSGIVLESRYLIPFTDYTIDYLQGRVLLTSPLPTVADDGQLISDGSLSGNPVYLVARYEHTPNFGDTDNMALGGRAESWVNEKLKVGVTASQEKQEDEDQTLLGADVTYRHSDGTYLKAEVAHTDGNGFGEGASFDGGFTFGGQPQDPDEDANGVALRVEGSVDFNDVKEGAQGEAQFYVQKRDGGFSAPGQLTAEDTTQWGVDVKVPVGEDMSVRAKIDERNIDNGLSNRSIDLDLTKRFDEQWSATVGLRRTELDDDSGSPVNRLGDRTDIAARLNYESGEDWSAYGFGQVTADTSSDRSDNSRLGVGGRYLLNDRITLGGEASLGDGGLGISATGDYKLSEESNVYLNFLSNSDRSDIGTASSNGSFAGGVRKRFNDELSVFAEERIYLGGGSGAGGLTHSFGLDMIPTERWNLAAFVEVGELQQPGVPELERTSITFSGNYTHEDTRYGGAVEFRDEEIAGNDRTVWVLKNNASTKIDDEWTLLGELNLLRSDDESGVFFDGEFTEALTGLAFRPTDNDRWNSLFTYRYLGDSPTSGQVNASGNNNLFQQRSHVLSTDVNFQANEWLGLGARYAIRASELRTEDTDWFESTAQLIILRADVHMIKDWDALLETRWTDVDLAEDSSFGFLTAVYRHVGNNLKLGVGYNFTNFSDDVTDLSYDAGGLFINLIGKF